jgi:hypothetical protein
MTASNQTGIECFDCNDDTTTDGFTDVIDNAYFCPSCWTERREKSKDEADRQVGI